MIRLLPLFFILFFWTTSHAQNDTIVLKQDQSNLNTIEISDDDLEQFYNDKNFNYEEVKKSEIKWWNDFLNWLESILMRFFKWIFGAEKAGEFLSSFLSMLPYLLLAFLIYIVIRFFIKANTRSIIYAKKNQNLVSLSEEERIIKTEDIQQLINQALKDKNYRLAIRYSYLQLLKLLSEKELIHWELQKTNADYLNELSNSQLKQPFEKATWFYDYVWYGEFDINEANYGTIATEFDNLKTTIVQS